MPVPDEFVQFTLHGVQQVWDGLMDVQTFAVYVSTMTTKKLAVAIMGDSQGHVPYLTGDLHDSCKLEKLEGEDEPGGIFSRFTVAERNIEGTFDAGKAFGPGVPMVAPAWAHKSSFGTKLVSKWAVSYSDDKAVYIHENIQGHEFQPRNPKRPTQYTENPTDHFLANAFDKNAPGFNAAMTSGLRDSIDAIHAKSFAREAEAAAEARAASERRAGAARLMAAGPRLVKKK
jgi:hypothetical protein